MKLCYDIYDNNNDGVICMVDIYNAFKKLKIDDFYLNNDVAKLSKELNYKQELQNTTLKGKKPIRFFQNQYIRI